MKKVPKDYYEEKAEKHSMPFNILTVIFGVMIVGCLLLAWATAKADADVTISWTPPTECINGDALGSTEQCPALTRFAFYCSTVSGGPYEWQWGTEAARLTDTRSYPDGEYYCVMRARNASGFSSYSNEIFFNVSTPPPTPVVPNPPTSITIQVRATN